MSQEAKLVNIETKFKPRQLASRSSSKPASFMERKESHQPEPIPISDMHTVICSETNSIAQLIVTKTNETNALCILLRGRMSRWPVFMIIFQNSHTRFVSYIYVYTSTVLSANMDSIPGRKRNRSRLDQFFFFFFSLFGNRGRLLGLGLRAIPYVLGPRPSSTFRQSQHPQITPLITYIQRWPTD